MEETLFTKTATDYLIDLTRFTQGKTSKSELVERWSGHKWSTQGLTEWARFYWKEMVK